MIEGSEILARFSNLLNRLLYLIEHINDAPVPLLSMRLLRTAKFKATYNRELSRDYQIDFMREAVYRLDSHVVCQFSHRRCRIPVIMTNFSEGISSSRTHAETIARRLSAVCDLLMGFATCPRSESVQYR